MADRGTLDRWGNRGRYPGRAGAVLALFMGVLIAGCGGSGGKESPAGLPPPAPPPAAPGQILFVSDREGRKQIYEMAPDGTGVRRWTTSGADDTSPAWSPDHTRVAFVSTRNGASHIFVAGAAGENPQDLTPGPAVCGAPAWSPDGTRLAYVQWELTGAQANIRVMRADGSASQPLTAGTGINGGPAWVRAGMSAAGGRIYFTTNRERGGTSFDMYVMEASGSDQHKVAAIPNLVGRPAVSPNGQRLAYVALIGPETPGLFVMDTRANSGGRMIGPANSAEPAWSPDGRQLLFTGWQDGNAEVYCMDTGGRKVKRLTDNAAADGGAAW